MARAIRIQYDEAAYHVMARGNRRLVIYENEADRILFLKTLMEAVEQYGLRIHAYCLMSNHYHLLVRTPLGNLAQGIGWLQFVYTIRWNRRHRKIGHLFQGRYKAQLIEEESYARKLLEYIHLNPVRIGVAKGGPIPSERWEQLKGYRWSSHRAYGGWEKTPEWLDLTWQHYFGRNQAEAHREYRRSIRHSFIRGVKSPWGELQQGLILGGKKFREKVRIWLTHKKGDPERRFLDRNRMETRARKLKALLNSEKDRKIQIWLRIRLGQEAKTRVGQELGYRDGAGIHMVILRLEQRARRNKNLSAKLERYRNICEV